MIQSRIAGKAQTTIPAPVTIDAARAEGRGRVEPGTLAAVRGELSRRLAL
jgi:hypothetical protein